MLRASVSVLKDKLGMPEFVIGLSHRERCGCDKDVLSTVDLNYDQLCYVVNCLGYVFDDVFIATTYSTKAPSSDKIDVVVAPGRFEITHVDGTIMTITLPKCTVEIQRWLQKLSAMLKKCKTAADVLLLGEDVATVSLE